MTVNETYDIILELRLTSPDENDEVVRFGIQTTNQLAEEDYVEFKRIGGELGLQDWLKRSFYRDKWTILPEKRKE